MPLFIKIGKDATAQHGDGNSGSQVQQPRKEFFWKWHDCGISIFLYPKSQAENKVSLLPKAPYNALSGFQTS